MNRPEEELDVQPTDDGWQIVVPFPGIAPGDLTIAVGDTELHIETLDTKSSQASGFRYRLTLPGSCCVGRTRQVPGPAMILVFTEPRWPSVPPRVASSTGPTRGDVVGVDPLRHLRTRSATWAATKGGRILVGSMPSATCRPRQGDQDLAVGRVGRRILVSLMPPAASN
jgi:hypothetical protein